MLPGWRPYPNAVPVRATGYTALNLKEFSLRVRQGAFETCTVIDGVLEIGISANKVPVVCRFLKHLVKFRNWGSKVPLNFYKPISKTPSMTVKRRNYSCKAEGSK